jgi:Holliday junction resolvase RusA-like endonuclease
MSGVARLVFEVPGLPMGKGRHRSFAQKGQVVHVADRKTESYEAQIKWFARQAMGAHGLHSLLTGPLWLRVTSFHLPNKQQEKEMEANPHREHFCTVKPDFDNIGKIVADALNGLVYRDDAIIADGQVVKRLSYAPRVVVSVGCLTD